jgi:tight adherence protein C
MRLLDELAGALGDWISRHTSRFREPEVKRRLLAAGLYLTSPGKYFGYRIMLTVGLPLVWLGFVALTTPSAVLAVFGFFVALATGWFGPSAYLNWKTRTRYDSIDRELPELIDILVVTIEAGVAFTGALRVASAHVTGPLGQELRLTLQEQAMGLATTEALKNTLVRADTPGMRIFVRAIVQGETLGVSIGQVMRNLAVDMRKRRRQAAEERAQRAPIKMLFPLVLLIFPAMFVVLLAPALIDIARTL